MFFFNFLNLAASATTQFMQELVTRSEFARRAGVSPAAVTKAAVKRIKAACVGKRIDFNHAKAKEYIAAQSGTTTAKTTKPPKKKTHTRGTAAAKEQKKQDSLDKLGDGKIHEVPADIEAFADMSLRELIRRFGTETAFMDWLKATKEIEIINEKRLKNAETMGELVSRDLIKVGIIEPIDTAHRNLLTDGAKTMSIRAIAMHKSGKSTEEIEAWISEQMTTFIRPVKAKVNRIIKQIGG